MLYNQKEAEVDEAKHTITELKSDINGHQKKEKELNNEINK